MSGKGASIDGVYPQLLPDGYQIIMFPLPGWKVPTRGSNTRITGRSARTRRRHSGVRSIGES